jgi:hypothetical protein
MIAKRCGGETRNTEIKAVTAKIGGGNTVGDAPGYFSTFYLTSTPSSPP